MYLTSLQYAYENTCLNMQDIPFKRRKVLYCGVRIILVISLVFLLRRAYRNGVKPVRWKIAYYLIVISSLVASTGAWIKWK